MEVRFNKSLFDLLLPRKFAQREELFIEVRERFEKPLTSYNP